MAFGIETARRVGFAATVAVGVAAGLAAHDAQAHYGMIIPDVGADGRTVGLNLSFSHPFDLDGMPLVQPHAFGVLVGGERIDLTGALSPAEIMGEAGFVAEHRLAAPGAHVFYMEPQPYWEPAEDVFIIHYTKVYVPAFDDDAGWDAMVGFPVEIEPLSRPFAHYAGNVFQGVVTQDGEPVPFAEVEVEFFNEDGSAVAPNELMITQTIRADANGVFTYAAPAAGWWGFAALITADETMEQDGVEKDVELGAVIWVRFEPWGGGE